MMRALNPPALCMRAVRDGQWPASAFAAPFSLSLRVSPVSGFELYVRQIEQYRYLRGHLRWCFLHWLPPCSVQLACIAADVPTSALRIPRVITCTTEESSTRALVSPTQPIARAVREKKVRLREAQPRSRLAQRWASNRSTAERTSIRVGTSAGSERSSALPRALPIRKVP